MRRRDAIDAPPRRARNQTVGNLEPSAQTVRVNCSRVVQIPAGGDSNDR